MFLRLPLATHIKDAHRLRADFILQQRETRFGDIMALRTRKETEEVFLKLVAEALREVLPEFLSKYKFEELADHCFVDGRPYWHKFYENPVETHLEFFEIVAGRERPSSDVLDLKSFLVDAVKNLENNRLSAAAVSQVKQLSADNREEQLFGLYASLLALLANLEHKARLESIYKKAKQGNRRALFTLIEMDKTILCWDWVQKEIAENQLRGNRRFFNGLSKAIKVDLFAKKKKSLIDWYQIQMLWVVAAPNKTYREFYEFLKGNTKFKLPNLKTFTQRLIRSDLTRRRIKSTLSNKTP